MSNQGRALITALNSGDYQSVDQYADLSDLDIKIVNSHVHELFDRAIRTENFKLFRALLKIPKVLVSGPEHCALRQATLNGLVEYVSEIVRVPTVNANLQSKDGMTALIAAVKGKWTQKKAVDLTRAILLTGKVRCNIKDGAGKTALHYALEKGWFEVAQLLVDAGAHPKVEDEEGQTPLFLALTGNNVPADLFNKMLSFDGDAPEEEADIAAPTPKVDAQQNDDSASTPPISFTNPGNRSPGVQSNGFNPPAKDDDAPVIKQVQSFVQDFVKDEPPIQAEPPKAKMSIPEDNADLNRVLEGQQIDDSLEKQFLFAPSQDGRMRLHRKAVLAQFEAIAEQLKMTGESFGQADCLRVDPATGLNLWHAAAMQGHFLEVLKGILNSRRQLEATELVTATEDGRQLVEFLEESAQLSKVLNDNVWNSRPQLLAALLSTLPERRLQGLASLVSRTNLLILNSMT